MTQLVQVMLTQDGTKHLNNSVQSGAYVRTTLCCSRAEAIRGVVPVVLLAQQGCPPLFRGIFTAPRSACLSRSAVL